MSPRLLLSSANSACRARMVPIVTRTALTRNNDRKFSSSSTYREPEEYEPNEYEKDTESSERTFNPNDPRNDPEFLRELEAYKAWMEEEGIQYQRSEGKPNYLQRGTSKKESDSKEEQPVEEKPTESEASGGKKSRRRHASPFPANPWFKSMPILSENFKEEIYQRVVIQGQSVRATSERFHVTMERVAAVVRMKQMERDRLVKRLPVVPYFAEKITEMLPQTHYQKGEPLERHESINDLPVHPATTQQIFWPTSESREFTRIDAGRVFRRDLLPADLRMPHPQTVEKWQHELLIRRSDALERMKSELKDKMSKKAAENARAEEENNSVVKGQRWDFKIEKINADWAGQDGRGRRGVGWRYGMPHEDRKRGMIKIPTKVE